MEKQIISYSLFTPIKLNEKIRTWDPFIHELRYWYNIPAIFSVNQIAYPDAEIHFYMPTNIKNQPLFPFLERLANSSNTIKLIFLDDDYSNTEPSLWRYKPVFNRDADIVLCRDLDSLPNEMELKATHYFLSNNGYLLQTLRTHKTHIFPVTVILAGLSAYRPKLIDLLDEVNFDFFYSMAKSENYGLDQKSIIRFFTSDENWTKRYFLDCPINGKDFKVGKNLLSARYLRNRNTKVKLN